MHVAVFVAYNAKHLQRVRVLAAQPNGQSMHLYRGDDMLHYVCLSVSPTPTIYSKSECRIKFKFIGDNAVCTAGHHQFALSQI